MRQQAHLQHCIAVRIRDVDLQATVCGGVVLGKVEVVDTKVRILGG